MDVRGKPEVGSLADLHEARSAAGSRQGGSSSSGGHAAAALPVSPPAALPSGLPACRRRTVEQELRMSLEDVFASVDPQPLASASIAQVRYGWLGWGAGPRGQSVHSMP